MDDRYIIPGQWHTVLPIRYGYEDCLPGHKFGPAIREHYLIHYIFSGNGFFEQGGVTFSLAEGDLFIIRPGEITTYYASRQNPWSYCWIGFSTLKEFEFLSNPVIRQPQVRHVFQRIRDCCGKDNPEPEIFAATFEIISILSQRIGHESLTTSEYAIYTKTHLDNAYMLQVRIADIARILHIDRRYLTAVFHKTYGVSPQEYLTNLRLERAREFLQSGCSVTDAASMSGFSDLCNFSRRFKAHFGLNPSAVTERQHI